VLFEPLTQTRLEQIVDLRLDGLRARGTADYHGGDRGRAPADRAAWVALPCTVPGSCAATPRTTSKAHRPRALRGDLQDGQVVRIGVADDDLTLDYRDREGRS
jgi:hypothetical protein